MIRGIIYIVLSGIAFFIVNFFVKLLGNPENDIIPHLQKYPAHELVFFRSLVSFLIQCSNYQIPRTPIAGE